MRICSIDFATAVVGAKSQTRSSHAPPADITHTNPARMLLFEIQSEIRGRKSFDLPVVP